MGRILFFLSEAFRALRRSAAPSMAAIVTIVVTTLLLGVLLPVLKASATTNANVRSQIALRVFLHDGATKAQIDALQKKIRRLPHVTKADYCSKECALRVLKTRVGNDLSTSLNELPRNPLPPSFNVGLDDPNNLEAVQRRLEPPAKSGQPKPISPIIDEVNDAHQESDAIRKVTDAVKIILGVIAVLLLVASLLLVANTIRLSIYARRREVEVMKLVGATDWFIRWPFIIEGIVVGLSGALVAVGLLWLGKVTVVDPLSNDFALVNNFSTVGFLPLVVLLIGSATAVAALGSGITLRRFLRI
jgi:cell division transport system permease protein